MEKIITCPNCNDILIISELNCCIFRHGIYKKQMNKLIRIYRKKYVMNYLKQIKYMDVGNLSK